MDYDVKQKIDFHGKAFMRDTAFSISRLLIVIFIVAIVFKGQLDMFIVLLMAIYASVTVLSVRRRMAREKKFYTFEPGNPGYDALTEYGNPEQIYREINAQIREGRTVFLDICKPNKANPETIITDTWFVHLNKKAVIFPLDKIICAYLYDHVTKETPPDKFLPTYFKPIFLIVTYGEKREVIIKYSDIKYKEALKALDEKLGCKVFYTRELGRLFNTDYAAFLEKAGEAREKHDEA